MLVSKHQPLKMSPAKGCEAGSTALPAAVSPSNCPKTSSLARTKSSSEQNNANRLMSDASSPFQRWRPSFHLIAPKNWMNDPCGPCYDEKTGLFHLLYQYNPHGAKWGNMSWMHATSSDLVRWQHVDNEPRLLSLQDHDKEGVFSGSMITTGPCGEIGQLTVIYTAVSHLPIHYTKPYKTGCEKVALAVSDDQGKTWRPAPTPVAIDGPPQHLADEVVSWRDPYLGLWPSMDQALSYRSGPTSYGLIAGSLKDKTPTVFLYAIDDDDASKWTFITHLADIGMNFKLNDYAGDMGRNWEVCNHFTHGGEPFLLLNVEGVDGQLKQRHAMWTKIKIRMMPDPSGTRFEPKIWPQYSSVIDYGCLYAATTFIHGPSGRRLMWGWVTEDDLAEKRYDEQGWSGCMSLPRELKTVTYENVDVGQLTRPFFSHTFWPVMGVGQKGSRALTIATMGTRPAAEVTRLRNGAHHSRMTKPASSYTLPIQSRNFEVCLEASFTDAGDAPMPDAEIGITLAHNASRTLGTRIIFSPFEEMLHVDRSKSSTDPDVDRTTKSAPLGLVRFADGSLENLRMRVFLDNSVLEVFVNDRIALTTRIYCDDDECALVSLFADKSLTDDTRGAPIAQFTSVESWSGLQEAMLPTETAPQSN